MVGLCFMDETRNNAGCNFNLISGCSMYIENVIEKKVLNENDFAYTTYYSPQEVKLDVNRHRIFAAYPCAGGKNICKVQVYDSKLDIHIWYAVKTNN